MPLSRFIVVQLDQIVEHWLAFGRTAFPPLHASETAELRDCFKGILLALAKDMDREGADAPDRLGRVTPAADGGPSSRHGALRQRCGGGVAQLVGEFGWLRASVLARWYFSAARAEQDAVLQQSSRFNQAVDVALSEAADSLAAAQIATRDTYLSTLGQDLRGPLSAIHSASATLARPDFAPGTRQNAARRVRQSLVRMDGLISDLQEYTRSRSVSGIPLERSPCDLEQVCQAAIDAARAAHPTRVFGLATSGCVVSNADAQRLQRALSNLLHNAVQHGDAHSLVKLVAAGDERAVTLSVWNAGPVIPAASLEAIFEPWVRVPGKSLDPPDRSAASLGPGLVHRARDRGRARRNDHGHLERRIGHAVHGPHSAPARRVRRAHDARVARLDAVVAPDRLTPAVGAPSPRVGDPPGRRPQPGVFMPSLRRGPKSMHRFDGHFFYPPDSQIPFGGCMDAVFIGLSVALVALLIGLVKVCDVLGDRS